MINGVKINLATCQLEQQIAEQRNTFKKNSIGRKSPGGVWAFHLPSSSSGNSTVAQMFPDQCIGVNVRSSQIRMGCSLNSLSMKTKPTSNPAIFQS